MRRLKLAGAMLGIFFAMTLTSKADVQIGAPGQAPSSCIPFGNCGYLGEYQQVYAGSAFTGITNLVSVSFGTTDVCDPQFANCTPAYTPGLQTLTMQVGLSTTAATPLNLSTDYTANIGADFAFIFSGTTNFTPQADGTFDLVLPFSDPFLFNPNAGNLLLDVFIFGAGPDVSFFGSTNDFATGSVSNDLVTGQPTLNETGLVTQFGEAAIPAVPEPDALLLLATVVGLLLVGRRGIRQARGTV